ncbi:SRPBCC family protein [Brachybacterium alimentarium]|uniref:SRPBCC family protein n=1 Tax=Brachybacterium alimentarium TaxID=47845 RepID=UPI003FD282C8
MSMSESDVRIVRASREIAAPAATLFELIADPAEQPRWDGNDNLGSAAPGQRVTAVGDVFVMTLTKGSERANHVVELEEGRRIAWKPGEIDGPTFGQLWRWELEPLDNGSTLVTHTYDWTDLHGPEARIQRARSTTAGTLRASIDRLAALVEG